MPGRPARAIRDRDRVGRKARRDAKRQGQLETELKRLALIPLLVVDEVGYIPFDPEAANLMFALVSSRYERASLIVTSNKPFSGWGEIFGDDAVATARDQADAARRLLLTDYRPPVEDHHFTRYATSFA